MFARMTSRRRQPYNVRTFDISDRLLLARECAAGCMQARPDRSAVHGVNRQIQLIRARCLLTFCGDRDDQKHSASKRRNTSLDIDALRPDRRGSSFALAPAGAPS